MTHALSVTTSWLYRLLQRLMVKYAIMHQSCSLDSALLSWLDIRHCIQCVTNVDAADSLSPMSEACGDHDLLVAAVAAS